MTEEKKYTLTEKREFFTDELKILSSSYRRAFKNAVDAYIEQANDFDHCNSEVHRITRSIKTIIDIKYADVCMLCHNFNEDTDLLKGIMHEHSSDHLYFIQSNHAIKIGRSSDVKRRLSTLQVDNPDNLKIKYIAYGKGMYEKSIHRLFDYLNIKGEWFTSHEDIYEYIELLKPYSAPREEDYSPFKDRGLINLICYFK